MLINNSYIIQADQKQLKVRWKNMKTYKEKEGESMSHLQHC